MIVQPCAVRLGIAKVMNTQIIFSGRGFQPKDSFAIDLLNGKGEKVIEYFVVGHVDDKGAFKEEVDKQIKISGILRGRLVVNKKGDYAPEITGSPIPEGVYKAKYVSMKSDQRAECDLLFKGPSLGDRFKDWLGVKTGKIVRK